MKINVSFHKLATFNFFICFLSGLIAIISFKAYKDKKVLALIITSTILFLTTFLAEIFKHVNRYFRYNKIVNSGLVLLDCINIGLLIAALVMYSNEYEPIRSSANWILLCNLLLVLQALFLYLLQYFFGIKSDAKQPDDDDDEGSQNENEETYMIKKPPAAPRTRISHKRRRQRAAVSQASLRKNDDFYQGNSEPMHYGAHDANWGMASQTYSMPHPQQDRPPMFNATGVQGPPHMQYHQSTTPPPMVNQLDLATPGTSLQSQFPANSPSMYANFQQRYPPPPSNDPNNDDLPPKYDS